MVHTGLLRHMRKEEGADSFIPLLIYVVMKANPDHLLSNVEYVLFGSFSRCLVDYLARFINRFRNPTKLQSEAGYYLSSLVRTQSYSPIIEFPTRSPDGGSVIHRKHRPYVVVQYHPRGVRKVSRCTCLVLYDV